MKRWLRPPRAFLWILPLAWLFGVYAPGPVILVVLALSFPALYWELVRASEQKGYWTAQHQVAVVMAETMKHDEWTEAEKLVHLVDGIIFQSTMPLAARRTLWERVRLRGRHRTGS